MVDGIQGSTMKIVRMGMAEWCGQMDGDNGSLLTHYWLTVGSRCYEGSWKDDRASGHGTHYWLTIGSRLGYRHNYNGERE